MTITSTTSGVVYDTDKLRKHGGPLTWGDNQVWLLDQAYLSDRRGEAVYKAHGIDVHGREVEVRWDIRADWDAATADDESDACDWDSPADVRVW